MKMNVKKRSARARLVATVALSAATAGPAGCSKDPATTSLSAEKDPHTRSAVPSAAPAPTAASAGGEALTPLVPTNDTEADVREMVARWNRAMASRDVAALSKIYASRVELYGDYRTRDAILKTKKKAFEASPGYTQTIGPVTVEDVDAEEPIARFEKRWTQNGKTRSVEAVLRIGVEGVAWHVVGETDGPSLARMKARENLLKGDCNTALAELVMSTPEVKKLLAGPKKAAAGHVTTNVLIEDGEAEGSRGLPAMLFRVAEDKPERVVTIAHFEVDFADHSVRKVDVANPDAEGKRLEPDPKKLEAAVLSCPEKFWE